MALAGGGGEYVQASPYAGNLLSSGRPWWAEDRMGSMKSPHVSCCPPRLETVQYCVFGLVCGSVIGRQAGSALDKGASQADQ